jgi:hypothetical protein
MQNKWRYTCLTPGTPGSYKSQMTTPPTRLSFCDLPPSLAPLYRAIANEIQDLCQSIAEDASRGVDFEAISTAMEDRRHLIAWLRRLGLPPASMANDCGVTPELEEVLLMAGSEEPG